jgi:hypothetical protein
MKKTRLLNFVESITWFASMTLYHEFVGLVGYFFFFLIELNYVIVYFSFYYMINKIVSEKKMLLSFRKSIGLLTCKAS